LTQEPRGQELIRRYKENYRIALHDEISEEMILKHWELEKSLTKQLLASTYQNRWETFERCYHILYSEIDWLNKLTGSNAASSISKEGPIWTRIIGELPKALYEVGSGKGHLISYLANCGYNCRGTEITRERGERFVSGHPNLSWGISDGVHLDQFECANAYDVVVSNQVIEHIHPDDLLEHFKSVRTILRNGGKYIFTTPHEFVGPSDISSVFKCEKLMGMHLKEYSYGELRELLIKAGFNELYSLWNVPKKVRRLSGIDFKPKSSRSYLTYLCTVEKLISLCSKHSIRRKLAFLSKYILFRPSIFVIAQK
jgi:SAM-dependent methyltransferase